MDSLKLITDPYDRKARLCPALLVLLPPVLTVWAFLNGDIEKLHSMIVFVVVTCGGAFFLAQIARDQGKMKEPSLFRTWGGMPSIAIFRHRDTTLDAITKQRYHKIMTTWVVESVIPTRQKENKKPEEADKTYTAWSTYLRTHTRDKVRFALLFTENINYGYRRNAWGMRTWGICLSLLSALSCAIGNPIYLYFIRNQKVWQLSLDPLFLCAFIISVCFLLFWIFKVNKSWVKIPADAYARRLVESIDELVVITPSKSSD